MGFDFCWQFLLTLNQLLLNLYLAFDPKQSTYRFGTVPGYMWPEDPYVLTRFMTSDWRSPAAVALKQNSMYDCFLSDWHIKSFSGPVWSLRRSQGPSVKTKAVFFITIFTTPEFYWWGPGSSLSPAQLQLLQHRPWWPFNTTHYYWQGSLSHVNYF